MTDKVVDWMQKQHLAGVGKTHFSSSAFSPQNLKSCFFVAFIPASPRLDLSPSLSLLDKKGNTSDNRSLSPPRQLYLGALTASLRL